MTSIASMFAQQVASRDDVLAISYYADDRWQTRTWKELAADVRRTAGTFVALGVKSGDRVVQFSPNRYEWILVDLALHVVGAVHVPVHAPLSGAQAVYQTEHSGGKLLILAGETEAEKITVSSVPLPPDVQVVSFDPLSPLSHLGRIRNKEIPRFSDVPCDAAAGETLWNSLAARENPNSMATILYTSGTTGQPKGVVLTHHNLVANAQGANRCIEITPDDVRLSFLPLSHIFARTCDLYGWLDSGSQMALARARDSVLSDCQVVHPTVMSGVPYFYSRLKQHVLESGKESVRGALSELLGGRIRMCCSGGAPLPVEVFDFFEKQQVPLLQGYGLTETSPVVTVSTPTENRRGTVGRPIAGVEIAIAEDGEVITRGPHVMVGYWQDRVATDAALRDGWFYTGDLGSIDEDGYLAITGRKKELIVTATGKNIAPTLIESLLTEDPLIAQAMVVGDNRNYLTALIVTEEVMLGRPADDQHLRPRIEEAIRTRLAELSHQEQIVKFALLPRPFSLDQGELTAKLSLRRAEILCHFADVIEAMYQK